MVSTSMDGSGQSMSMVSMVSTSMPVYAQAVVSMVSTSRPVYEQGGGEYGEY